MRTFSLGKSLIDQRYFHSEGNGDRDDRDYYANNRDIDDDEAMVDDDEVLADEQEGSDEGEGEDLIDNMEE